MLAIIPARGGSKRLPRKNILPFHGKPIIAYPIKTALDSGMFRKVIVSSDDDEILSIAREYGAWGVKRPAELATDTASEIDAYLHVLADEPCDVFCALYPCAAFVTPTIIQDALKTLLDDGADCIMGVTKFAQHPYQMLTRYSDFYHLRWPDLNEEKYPPAYASNGSIYMFRTAEFLANPTYYPARLSIIETPNIDINTQDDFNRAEKVYRECTKVI